MQKSIDEKLTDELFIALCLKEQSKEQSALGYLARDSDLGHCTVPRPSALVTHRYLLYSSSIDSCKTGINFALGITGDREGDLWPWGTLDCKQSNQSVTSLLCRAWNTSDTPSMCLLVRMISQLSLSPRCTVECFKFTNIFFVEILCPVWTTA